MSFAYNPTLGIATVTDVRVDYRTAQVVNVAIGMLASRNDHEAVTTFLNENMVTPQLRRKVLAGHAVRRL